jgi:hypothetical protein
VGNPYIFFYESGYPYRVIIDDRNAREGYCQLANETLFMISGIVQG